MRGVQRCVHGYNQQQQDMACVKCTTLCTWVQSTATRHGIRVVYNVVYIGTVNSNKTWIRVVYNIVYMGTVNSNKTWHTCSVHGYSQQQQDMACVKCTTLCTWVQSTATRHGIRVVYNVVYIGTVNSNKTWIRVVYNIVYMGTVNSNKTWHVLICVVYTSNK